MNHICDYCQLGPFCDCGRVGGSDSTYNQYPQFKSYTYYTLKSQLNEDDTDAITRLNEAIKKSKIGYNKYTEVHTCKEDIMSWKEWIVTGRTLLLATLRKTKSVMFWRNSTGR